MRIHSFRQRCLAYDQQGFPGGAQESNKCRFVFRQAIPPSATHITNDPFGSLPLMELEIGHRFHHFFMVGDIVGQTFVVAVSGDRSRRLNLAPKSGLFSAQS
jgi:hypothetical protein